MLIFITAMLVGLVPGFCAGFAAAAIVIVIAERLPSVRAIRMEAARLPDWITSTSILVGLAAASALLYALLEAMPRPEAASPSEQAALRVAREIIIVFGIGGGLLGGWAAATLRGRRIAAGR